MINSLHLRRWSLRWPLAVILAAVTAGAMPARAQDIGGSYVLAGDSDGTKPRTGARLQLTFSGKTAGKVSLFATRPGETIRDSGNYAIQDHRITIHFKEVDWAAQNQPFEFDGCTLTLPFKAVSATEGPGTSAWQREDPKCGMQRAGIAQGEGRKAFTSFSADERITEEGRQKRGRIFITEKAIRAEGEESGTGYITIMRLDRNVLWSLLPQQKTYTETPLNLGKGIVSLARDEALAPGCSIAGEEKVAGYLCVKQECRIAIEGKSYSETRWAAKQLGGIIIKYVSGSQALEFENIKSEALDPKLFELPAEYRKVSAGIPNPER